VRGATALGGARRGGAIGFGFASLATALALATMPAPAQRSPTALYDAAYDRWRGLAQAPFATYDGRFVLVRNAKTQVRLYTVAYRNSDRRCRVTGVAIDAKDRPDPPEVTKRCLTPAFAFTFIPQTQEGADAAGLNLNVPTPDPTESADLKTLASVRARSRPYAVTPAGEETIDGKLTEHLALRPYRNPEKHVLRDVWIDPVTNGVVRLRGEATSGPNLIHVNFEATYDEDATTQTLVRVDAFAKAQLLFLRASGNVSFELDNVAYPGSLPDAMFSMNGKR
jgi:hypothetical protein